MPGQGPPLGGMPYGAPQQQQQQQPQQQPQQQEPPKRKFREFKEEAPAAKKVRGGGCCPPTLPSPHPWACSSTSSKKVPGCVGLPPIFASASPGGPAATPSSAGGASQQQHSWTAGQHSTGVFLHMLDEEQCALSCSRPQLLVVWGVGRLGVVQVAHVCCPSRSDD
jgi:hypothetical protein